MRLNLVRVMRNVGLHSNLKPFTKFLRRLVDIIADYQVFGDLTEKRAKTTPICLRIPVNCSVKRDRRCREDLLAFDSDYAVIRRAERRSDFV